MEIRIVIDAPKGWKRRALLLAGALLGLIAVPAVIAHAYDTSWIVSGGPVSASSLAADLNEAQSRIAALEAFKVKITADGGYFPGATYCGATGNTNGQITNAYAGAKALCQAVTGCSTSAHVCTADELARTKQLGKAITVSGGSGWYSTALYSYDNGYLDDCYGWTSNSTAQYGSEWVESVSSSLSYAASCNTSLPVLCCD